MDVIRHNARGVSLTLMMYVSVKDAFEDKVSLGRREFSAFVSGEGHHVFRPGSFEMREIATRVLGL